jgi:hypothetical protein
VPLLRPARVSARLDAAKATLRKALIIAKRETDEETRREFLRRVIHDDPLLFALLVLPQHLRDSEGRISLSTVHEQWIEAAQRWGTPTGPAEERDAYVAPREMGKSTWFFLLLPMWAAATGRVKFAAAFADSSAQAEGHLTTFKKELDENGTLRDLYPDLCRPARRGAKTRDGGISISDNRALLVVASGFVFAARGIDSGTLGMKVGATRPDLLILDDIEPGESNYSGYQVEKRLGTVLDVVLPLNVAARVVLVGTVTMPGSIVHQLVKHASGEEPAEWVKDERFRVHHALPFVYDEEGEASSVWPEKWPTEWLLGQQHTRSFAKNFLNEPVATDGDYWTPETFKYGTLTGVTRVILSVDPNVTTKTTSDFSGLAVVGFSPSLRKCAVRRAWRVKKTGAALRLEVVRAIEADPTITHVLIETNQGGEMWLDIFHDLPVRVLMKHNTEKKEVRAAEAVNHYERGNVLHEEALGEAEREMCAFPKAPHDDVVDAVVNAVNRLLKKRPPKKRAGGTSVSYG